MLGLVPVRTTIDSLMLQPMTQQEGLEFNKQVVLLRKAFTENERPRKGGTGTPLRKEKGERLKERKKERKNEKEREKE